MSHRFSKSVIALAVAILSIAVVGTVSATTVVTRSSRITIVEID